MSHLIDRRLQGKNKSVVNRDRFLKRYKTHIKKAVADAVSGRSITDIEKGDKVSVPVRDLKEPSFGHGSGGIWDFVRPGNQDYLTGDQVKRPSGGGKGKGKAGNSEEQTEDEFTFNLSSEEFMNYFFEDLALPDLIKTDLEEATDFKLQRAGYTTSGTSSNIAILRSLRGAVGRRIGIGGGKRSQLNALEEEYEGLENSVNPDTVRMGEVKNQIAALKRKLAAIPFIDPIDLRFTNRIKVPKPTSSAVMFCVMDVSGSMDQEKKDIAKRFFILLYLFLTRAYEQTEVVFIRHHTSAKEVDEHEFFNSRESGGTVVSSAIDLLSEIINARYAGSGKNLYVAQASDGDNWGTDTPFCINTLRESVLPLVQYMAYIEITKGDTQNLWEGYSALAQEVGHLALQKITEPADIYPVFRELFKKKTS